MTQFERAEKHLQALETLYYTALNYNPDIPVEVEHIPTFVRTVGAFEAHQDAIRRVLDDCEWRLEELTTEGAPD